jgi:hypothetical protein
MLVNQTRTQSLPRTDRSRSGHRIQLSLPPTSETGLCYFCNDERSISIKRKTMLLLAAVGLVTFLAGGAAVGALSGLRGGTINQVRVVHGD